MNKLGKLSKQHGFKGEVILIADIPLNKNIEKTELVFLMIDGLPVPFFVSRLLVRTENTAIVKFDDINTAEELEEFIGAEVYLEGAVKKKRKSKSEFASISGYTLLDIEHGNIGIADQVIDYSGNLLIRAMNGNKELLIPVSEESILEINDKTRTIKIATPEGLLDLF